MSFEEPSSADAEVLAEIETYAVEAMSRFGAPGDIRVDGYDLVLDGPTGTTRSGLGTLPGSWGTLSDDSRRRRVGDVVRRLLSNRPAPPKPRRSTAVPGWVWLIVLGTAGVIGATAMGMGERPEDPGVVRRKATSASSTGHDGSTSETGRQRAARVCEETRARVLRGATIGPTDVEGWVVDALILKRGALQPLDADPVLRTFVKEPSNAAGSSFIWPEEPALVALEGSDTLVKVSRENVTDKTREQILGVRLSFGGRLTDYYFDPEKRRSFFHIVNSLTDALGGTHAGLFARCADGATHHIGSWFRGNTPADAATSLVYMLGTFASPPHLADPFLHPVSQEGLDRGHAFSSIAGAESHLDQRTIAALVGKSNGMISGPAGGPYTITFAFGDGNRASRASRDLASATSIARPD